jgi:glycosyltransferase involved in cell wall biosynthesis
LKFTEIQSKSRIAKLSKILNIDTNVVFFDPVKKYYNKYREASILVMTSRTEDLNGTY